jgi:hypothetical protein
LLAARSAWIFITALTVVLTAVGFTVAQRRPELMRERSVLAIMVQAGFSRAAATIILLVVITVSIVTGVLIFWQRSDDWVAMLFSLLLITLSAGVSVLEFSTKLGLAVAVPWLALPAWFVAVLSVFLVLIGLFIFPDGRFVPSWTAVLGVAAAPAAVLVTREWPLLFTELSPTGRDSHVGARLAVLLVVGFWAIGLCAQIYRYRHVSGPVQRQQAKWVAFPLLLVIGVPVLGILSFGMFPDVVEPWLAWALFAAVPLQLLFPLSVAVAILRYRLYDIDRLVSRTIAYALVTAVLGLVYAVSVLVLGQVLRSLGGSSAAAVAGSTLLAAALFGPLRRRVQGTVDRRFNRRGYDAAKTIDAFSARLRGQIDLDSVSAELLTVTDLTMQPLTARLWLRPAADPRSANDRAGPRPWR